MLWGSTAEFKVRVERMGFIRDFRIYGKGFRVESSGPGV